MYIYIYTRVRPYRAPMEEVPQTHAHTHTHTHTHTQTHTNHWAIRIYICIYVYMMYIYIYEHICMYRRTTIPSANRRNPLVGSLKIWVSFTEYHLLHRALLQKRHVFLGSLLTIGLDIHMYTCIYHIHLHLYIHMYTCIHDINLHKCTYMYVQEDGHTERHWKKSTTGLSAYTHFHVYI